MTACVIMHNMVNEADMEKEVNSHYDGVNWRVIPSHDPRLELDSYFEI